MHTPRSIALISLLLCLFVPGCWDMTSCQVMWARVYGTRPEPDGGQFSADYYFHI